MQRREFLRTAGLGAAGAALGRPAWPRSLEAPPAEGWRTFDVVTRVEVLQPSLIRQSVKPFHELWTE